MTVEEARQFLLSRTPEEKKYYDIDADREIRTSEYLSGTWHDGELIGVGGVGHAYWFFHYSFNVVCQKAQGNGYGREQQKSSYNYARESGIPLFVQTIMKGNTASKRLQVTSGGKLIYETRDSYHFVKVFTGMGSVIAPFVPLLLAAYYSPFGELVRKFKTVSFLRM